MPGENARVAPAQARKRTYQRAAGDASAWSRFLAGEDDHSESGGDPHQADATHVQPAQAREEFLGSPGQESEIDRSEGEHDRYHRRRPRESYRQHEGAQYGSGGEQRARGETVSCRHNGDGDRYGRD